jgi:hypothetical protein
LKADSQVLSMAPSHVTFLLNFADELRRRTAAAK